MSSFLRKMIAASVFTTCAAAAHSQTLFNYGSKAVTKEEFLKAYNKNNTEEKPTEKTYHDYLDLYTRFKIKVQAALDLKLDTLSNQQQELAAFRNQVVESYMNDEASVQVLIDEAMDRSKKDIHLAHIFIAAGANMQPEQVKQAQQKANTAYAQLQKGEDFLKTALAYSDDPAVQANKGDIGYITVLVLPYEMENLVYATPAGKYTAIYRSKNGFHIFKNLGERPAIGRLRAAHILLSFPPAPTEAQKKDIAKVADSLYTVLQNGGDFKMLAGALSGDNLTFQTGGEMMAFGVGRYEPAFEKAAFALAKDGDISHPVLTDFGYHIIKRLQHVPVPADKTNKQWQDEIKQQVLQSDRMEVARKVFVKKIMQLIGLKKAPVNAKALSQYTDSILLFKKPVANAALNENTTLVTIGKKTIKGKDYKTYLETLRGIESMRTGKTSAQLLDQYIENTAADHYRQHLEEYNKEFAWQLNEFKEGNLLFEIMQQNIWDKASVDSIGLKKYYDEHKNTYWWEMSADAVIVTAVTQAASDDAAQKIKANYKSWKTLVEKSEGTIQADSGRFELGQIPVVERTNFQPGLLTAPVKNDTDNSLTFAYIIKMYPDRQPRSFNDARGFVINDYQAYLEDQWIAELKKKYPVRINEAVLKSLPQ